MQKLLLPPTPSTNVLPPTMLGIGFVASNRSCEFNSVRKITSLDDHIYRASWLAVRARVNLDLFAFLSLQSNLDKFEAALADRANLFDFVRSANEHEFLNRIVNLFTRRNDTDNFPRLIRKAEHEFLIGPAECASINAEISVAQTAFKIAQTIRNKVVSHQDHAQTKPDIYKQEKPSLRMFLELSDHSLSITGALCSARGFQPHSIFTAPNEQLEEMLSALLP